MTLRQVLVLDADQLSALSVVRSLGRSGWTVFSAGISHRAVAFRSRYADRCLCYPDPLCQREAFLEWLQQVLSEHSFDLVVPITDSTIGPILRVRETLETLAPIAIPPNDAMEKVLSKCHMHRLATSIGLRQPQSWIIQDRAELQQISTPHNFPLVIKAEYSRAWLEGFGQQFETRYADNWQALEQNWARYSLYGQVLVQSVVRGHGVGLGILARHGQLVDCFQYRRLHELPLTGGGSAYRVSEDLDRDLERQAKQLIENLGWHGVIMMEFKYDPEQKIYWFIEANGRFWGALPLALVAGVDFPARLAALYRNETIHPSTYVAGIRCRNLERDIDWIRAAWSHPQHRMTQILADTLRIAFPREHLDSFAVRDPRPLVAELRRIGCRLLSACRRRLGGSAIKARINNLRMHPEQLTKQLHHTKRIVVVCSGNIMRSAFAAGYLRHKLSCVQYRPDIVSVGLDTQAGRPADPLAREVALEFGLSLERHRARSMDTLPLGADDIIFVMDHEQMATLTRRYPAQASQLYPVTCLAPKLPKDITDPNGEGPLLCKQVFSQLAEALSPVVEALSSHTHRAP